MQNKGIVLKIIDLILYQSLTMMINFSCRTNELPIMNNRRSYLKVRSMTENHISGIMGSSKNNIR